MNNVYNQESNHILTFVLACKLPEGKTDRTYSTISIRFLSYLFGQLLKQLLLQFRKQPCQRGLLPFSYKLSCNC